MNENLVTFKIILVKFIVTGDFIYLSHLTLAGARHIN